MLLNNLYKKYPYAFLNLFYDMLLMSYAYYYSYYEKSPNDKPKGAHRKTY